MSAGMRTLWNDGWKFVKLPLGSTYQQMLAADKQTISLPHDWLIVDTDHLYESGDGWYIKPIRRTIPGPDPQRTVLSFDGVYMDADILVNGNLVTTHRYGYTAFLVDVTDHLTEAENQLAVHIRHQSPNSRWYSGAGIYRDVYVMSLPERHILPDGIQVNTFCCGSMWTLSVQAEMNRDGEEAPLAVLRDAQGVVIAQQEMALSGVLADLTVTLPEIRPWSAEEPNLYSLTLTLGDQTETLSVGFRTLLFDADRGFFLNGRHMKLHGVCMHHDLGALGASFFERAAERQLRIMKEMGVNAIRTSHNPPARKLLDLCDRMGLLVMDEIYDMWEMAKTPYDNARFFPDTWRQDVAKWIRRDRCHPCVILWSIGNEIQDMNASQRGQMWTRLLAEEVRKHDDRHAAVTFASNYMPWEGAQKCADIVKMPGYNYAEKYYAEHHRAHPDWVIFGSETGSLLASRGIYHFPMNAEILSEEDLQCSALLNSNTSWGARDLRKMLVEDRITPYSMGQFVWSGFDYIGEPTPYHTRSCYFGQTDTAGFPKDAYYFYQAMWTDAPMVHIGIYWDWNDGQLIDVPVMSNAASVELLLNGRSLGKKAVDRDSVEGCLPVWRVPYEKGTLEARAYDAEGRLMCTEIRRSFGEGKRILLSAERTSLRACCGDLAFITAAVMDEDGNPVENACDRLHVSVTGPGALMGLDNGDSTDRDGYQTDSRRLFSGKLLLILGAGSEAGEIHVTVTGKGLEPADMTLTVDPFSGDEKRTLPSIRLLPAGEDETWIRRIDIRPLNGTVVTPDCPAALFEIKPLPRPAMPQHITLRVTNAQGVDLPCVKMEREGSFVRLTGIGDGQAFLRAAACNGYDHPRVLSVMEIMVQGFGPMGLDPYGFVAGVLHDKAEGMIGAGNEQGLSFAREEYSAAGFSNVDFGPVGSDEITLPVFALDGEQYDIHLWDGMPGEGGSLIAVLPYQKPSIWNVYQAETYRLPTVLRGVHTLAFSLDRKIHLKGFSFTRQSRADRYIRAAEADKIYGDSYCLEDQAIRKIGNNVTLQFDHFDFLNAGKIMIRLDGETPLDDQAVNVLIVNEAGEERLSMCSFQGKKGRTGQTFRVSVPEGPSTVSFIFLPGSQFDFYGFAFTEVADGDSHRKEG